MPQTLSVIKADVGGYVGHSAMHHGRDGRRPRGDGGAMQSGLLIDAHVSSCGDDMFLIMSHDRGENDEQIHHLAWDAFIAGTEVAKKLHLYGAGQDLLVDAFSGNIRGAGPGSAELELEERPSEPVIVFMGDKTSAGSFNLPFYKMFADPFNTAGLVIAESLHEGFAFEVHDVKEHRKIVLNAPEEIYELLVFIGSPSRYAIKRVISRGTGEVGGVSSTDKLSLIAGRYVGKDDPAAVVRCQGAFPAVGEVLEPFTTPYTVEGFMRGSHYGPWMPVAARGRDAGPLRRPASGRGAGLPTRRRQAHRPARHVRDLSFDNARIEANRVSDYLRKHGPFEPHRLPLDELEYTTLPAVAATMESRWAEI